MEEQKIELKVGGVYSNRRGELIKIVEYNPEADFPFIEMDGTCYKTNGHFSCSVVSGFDLVKDVTDDFKSAEGQANLEYKGAYERLKEDYEAQSGELHGAELSISTLRERNRQLEAELEKYRPKPQVLKRYFDFQDGSHAFLGYTQGGRANLCLTFIDGKLTESEVLK